MRARSLVAFTVLAVAAAACGDTTFGDSDEVAGDGNVTVDERDVTGFTEVVLAGEGDLTLTFGAADSLAIEADDNLHQHILSTVEDGRLVIRTEDGIDIEPTQPPEYRVGIVDLAFVELSGVGGIDIGSWQAGSVSVRMSGVGQVTVDDLAATDLTSTMTGVGGITVAGTVTEHSVVVDGVGEYEATDLRSSICHVTAKGNGVVRVWATQQLFAEADGLSKVEYYGPAELFPTTDSLGTIMSLGDK